jgi:UDP-N-acetylmuramoylalanine--D-glutamate ligase
MTGSPGRDAPRKESGVHGKQVAIVGLGESGFAAARLALEKGAKVHVSEKSTDARARARGDRLAALGARIQFGDHDLARIQAAELVVVSPGIPPDAPVLVELRRRGVRWISEPEFAVRFYQGALIAVTGTNGKTTTAALTAHLLEAAEIPAALGGNVGGGLAPAASELALMDTPPAWYVLEVSSFQLADVDTFAPDIGVVTNLSPDHLDRYPDTGAYYADKARLFRNAEAESRWVLNGEQPEVLELAGDAAGTRYTFGLEPREGRWAYLRDDALTLRALKGRGKGAEETLVPRSELPLLGRFNVMNALAAALTARLAGADPRALGKGLGTFRPLPHRLEPVAERGGVLWVNDSKATNVAAAVGAVESLDRPLVVILGGKDKGEDFGSLVRSLEGRARAVVLYGEAAPRLERALASVAGSGIPVASMGPDFDAAVATARSLARKGDAVLLAPACSSFDLFESYGARGRRFQVLARGEGDER